MKEKLITASVVLLLISGLNAQTKYYTVKSINEEPEWRDELFVIKVSSPSTQKDIANELLEQFNSRSKIVIGDLSNGNGGFNKNGSHCFNWHLIDDTVTLVELTVELCDGRAFSDVEEGDFLNTVGYYCPWAMRVFEEISIPPTCSLSSKDYDNFLKIGSIFPNPANDRLTIKINNVIHNNMQVALFNMLGELVYFEKKPSVINQIKIADLNGGVYMMTITLDGINYYTKFIKN